MLSSHSDQEVETLDDLLGVDPKEMAGARAIMDTIKAVQSAYLQARHTFKMKQQHIALRLGIGRAAVNKRLLGRENMTIRTLGELAWAMGYRLRITLVPDPDRIDAGNWYALPKDTAPLKAANEGVLVPAAKQMPMSIIAIRQAN